VTYQKLRGKDFKVISRGDEKRAMQLVREAGVKGTRPKKKAA
jgi:hypothetical protein